MAASKHIPYGQGRDELVSATLGLIGRLGAHAFTMRQVAGDAQMVVGSLSHHFASRSALVVAAFEEHVQRTEDVVSTAVAAATHADTTSAADLTLLEAIHAIHSDPHTVMIRTELRMYAARNPDVRPLNTRLTRSLNNLADTLTVTHSLPANRPDLSSQLDAIALGLIAAGTAEDIAAMVDHHLPANAEA